MIFFTNFKHKILKILQTSAYGDSIGFHIWPHAVDVHIAVEAAFSFH